MLWFLMTLIALSVLASVQIWSSCSTLRHLGKSSRMAPVLGLALLAVAMMAALPGSATAQTTDEAPVAAAAEADPGDSTAPAEPTTAAAEEESPANMEPSADAADESATAEEPAPDSAPDPGDAAEQPPAEAEPGTTETPSEQADAEVPADGALVEQVGTTTVEPARPINWLPFVLFLIVSIGAFAISAGLASSLRTREYQAKMTIILLCLMGAAAVVYSGWPPKLGIDLKGGVYLVYELGEKASASLADAATDQQETDETGNLSTDDMNKLVSAISRRINPGGVKEVVIRPFGKNQIEIVIPEVDESEIERYKEKIVSAGTLEFRILANNRDHRSLIEDARKSDAQFVYMLDAEGKPTRDEKGAPILRGWWVPVSEDGRENNPILSYEEIAKRTRQVGERTVTDILVVKDPYDVTGGYLVRSAPGVDQSGRPNVTFMFNAKGGQLFGGLTSDNLPDEVSGFTRKLGIVLDEYLFSAPSIQSQIRERGEITGSFTKQEVADLVDVLNAGMLPTTLKEEPISQMATGPTLGSDTIRRGGTAILISMVLVLVFMIIYYRFAGVVACVAMLANLLLILGVMILVKAAFTLPGIAGLVLTVGMAVDANVLIFERIREELDRQATLRMAIRNGFARATTTIVDANLTTLITGVVLYTIGTDQVKGFAVTLILGVTLSMFTAIYCARVIFDIAEKKRWLKKMSMARIPLSGTIDFIGLRRMAGVASMAVIVIGLIGVIGRGKGLMDIDFTGGVSVQTVFKQDQSIDEIRKVLNAREDVFDDLAVSEVNSPDQPPHRQFVINTARPDDETDADAFLEKVKQALEEVFGDQLVHHSMAITRADDSAETDEAPAAEENAPAESETSMRRSDLPSDELIAAADDAGIAPAEAPAAEASEETDAPASPDEAKPEDAAAAPVAESASQTPADPLAAATADIEPVTWNVQFGTDKITYVTLEKSIQKQMETLGTNAFFQLTNPDFAVDYDRDRGRDSWTVSISLPAEQGAKVLEGVKASVEKTPVFPSSNTIGGKVATDTQLKAIAALLASLVFIVAYIWIRFQRVMFGLAAVVALVHDVLIALGAIALTAWLAPFLGVLLIDEFKIGLPVLAAFLTIIGYSLNDTIVVFDRIREVRGKSPNLTGEMINKSINQTLSRTLLTSFTTLIVVVILYAFGGQAIRVFAFSLVVGVVVGTYSSVFVASPVLLWIAQTSAAKPQRS